MRRHLLIALLVVTVFALGARSVRAAILPACDQTVYLLQDPNQPDNKCDPAKAGYPGCRQLSQSDYLAQYDTPEKQKANPPTVTTNTACGFNDFIQLFINLSNWGLGVMATLALGFTIWGGTTLMLSGGSQEKVKEGKQTIWGGVLGITIVLTAWILIGFVTSALTGTGFVLFKDTPWARNFFGTSNCNASFKACSWDNLKKSCKDTPQNGDAVSLAQNILSEIGCYNRSVDGCFGTNTEATVKAFQRANQGCNITVNGSTYNMPDYRINPNIREPDGIVGPTTWAFLKGASENIPTQCPGLFVDEKVRGC